ncbi:MAG TPA: hypothetical protein DEH78_17475 [Solibacterales bacterium]|nr:hypothetical protein [Bryobacterales bacterium]
MYVQWSDGYVLMAVALAALAVLISARGVVLYRAGALVALRKLWWMVALFVLLLGPFGFVTARILEKNSGTDLHAEAPPVTLVLADGKRVSLSALKGKTVLLDFWATWCAPCRAEHPVFQKLYDELKSRSDVSVITFNVDHDVSKVAPYMAENKYTFPVLLASEVVDRVLDAVAIPQNWFLTKSGKLEVLQVGFNSEPDWRDKMVAKLEEVGKLP